MELTDKEKELMLEILQDEAKRNALHKAIVIAAAGAPEMSMTELNVILATLSVEDNLQA